LIGDLGNALFGDNHDIGGGRKPGFMESEILPDSSFQIIPLYSLSHLFTDYKA